MDGWGRGNFSLPLAVLVVSFFFFKYKWSLLDKEFCFLIDIVTFTSVPFVLLFFCCVLTLIFTSYCSVPTSVLVLSELRFIKCYLIRRK